MQKVLIVCGPTATGKTKLAVSLAKRFDGELVNADSRQMYKGFDILSGKDIPKGSPLQTKEDVRIRGVEYPLGTYVLDGIPVWLYDVVAPDGDASIAVFRDLANHVISDIEKRGKLPIIVGGTGYYLSSLSQPIASIDIPQDASLRNALAHASLEYLQQKLAHEDQKRWEAMNHSDRKNPRRLVRALEVAAWKQLHALHIMDAPERDMLWIGLEPNPAKSEASIRSRVEERMRHGAVEEVDAMKGKSLSPHSASIIGYPVLTAYRAGTLTEDEAKDLWTRKELQYAKRQMTWFRKQPSIMWYKADAPDSASSIEKAVAAWYTTNRYADKD